MAVKSKEQAHHSPLINRIWANISKFAIDSAFIRSLKGVSGLTQLHKVVQEKLQYVTTPLKPSTDKHNPNHALMAEELEAQMEEMRVEVNGTKVLSNASCWLSANGPESFSTPPEDCKDAGPPKPNKKKIMIRSRL